MAVVCLVGNVSESLAGVATGDPQVGQVSRYLGLIGRNGDGLDGEGAECPWEGGNLGLPRGSEDSPESPSEGRGTRGRRTQYGLGTLGTGPCRWPATRLGMRMGNLQWRREWGVTAA